MTPLFHRLALLLALCALAGGCATGADPLAAIGPQYQPDNVFRYGRILSPTVRRVAVLPLVPERATSNLPEGCDALNPVLLNELIKTKKFEVVSINPEKLRRQMGRAAWSATDTLPANFFESLQRTHGCDAVLFCELTVFRAYAPLAIGWRLKLVDARSRQVLWAADEVIDASSRPVATGVTRYKLFACADESDGDWAVKNSPRQFGRYAAARLFSTLPER